MYREAPKVGQTCSIGSSKYKNLKLKEEEEEEEQDGLEICL